MNRAVNGVARQGLDSTFAADEMRKSDLLLAAQLLRAQGQSETSADKFAEAAALEESLSERAGAAGLKEKAWTHSFSAASCWAQAGNFYQALNLCDALLAEPDLHERLRRCVQEYARQLRDRRASWFADLELATMGTQD